MSEATSSPHDEKAPKPMKRVGAPAPKKEDSSKDTARKLQEERKVVVQAEREGAGLLERRLDVSKAPEELYFLRCPDCNGEGAYFRQWPAGRWMTSDDWFTTYKGEGEGWTWDSIPCQECWDRGRLTPLRIESAMPAMEIGKEQRPMFLLTGKWTRFIGTRSHIEKLKRMADAERNAINARLAAIAEAKKEAARV